MKDEHLGIIYLVLFSFTGGLVGVVVNLAQGIDSFSLAFLRGLSAIIFLFIVILQRKRFKELKIVMPINTIAIGILEGLSILFYFLAVTHTTVSNAIFLVYLAPVYSMILSVIILKEKIQKRSIYGLILAIIGVLLIVDPRQLQSIHIGDIYALLAGFFYAAMAIVAKPITKKKSSYYIAFWQYFIITLMFLFFYKPDISLLIINWWQILILGVFCSGIAFVIFMEGVKRIEGQKIFIVTSLEPFFGTILAFFFLKEVPSPLTLIGGIVIISGVYLISQKTKEK